MNNGKARLELAIIAVTAIVIAIVEYFTGVLKAAINAAAQNGATYVTASLAFIFVLAVGLAIFAWRRSQDAAAVRKDRTARLEETVFEEHEAMVLMRSYADAVTRGQEAERRRLARELHDDTIQRLILLNQKVELAAFDHAESDASEDLVEMKGVLTETIDSVRHFIHELRPIYLEELGLVAALGTLIKETRERTDLLIEFESPGQQFRLSESLEMALYRIVQTALSNVVQHADATMVRVLLEFRPNAINLSIEDDGIGFEPRDEVDLVAHGHFGLIGMRERAELMGATYDIESAKNKGTTVSVSVPLSPS